MQDIRRITWQQGTDVRIDDVATPAEVITKCQRIRREGGSITSVVAMPATSRFTGFTSEEIAAWN